jgi:hypothetical protein
MADSMSESFSAGETRVPKARGASGLPFVWPGGIDLDQYGEIDTRSDQTIAYKCSI